MRKTPFVIPFLFASVTLAFNNPLERWANAVGGLEKVAAIKAIYREAAIEYGFSREFGAAGKRQMVSSSAYEWRSLSRI